MVRFAAINVDDVEVEAVVGAKRPASQVVEDNDDDDRIIQGLATQYRQSIQAYAEATVDRPAGADDGETGPRSTLTQVLQTILASPAIANASAPLRSDSAAKPPARMRTAAKLRYLAARNLGRLAEEAGDAKQALAYFVRVCARGWLWTAPVEEVRLTFGTVHKQEPLHAFQATEADNRDVALWALIARLARTCVVAIGQVKCEPHPVADGVVRRLAQSIDYRGVRPAKATTASLGTPSNKPSSGAHGTMTCSRPCSRC